MNITLPDPGERIHNSPHRASNCPTGWSPKSIEQKLSLFAGVFFIAFYLLSSLWISSHRRFWYDELSTVLIARLPNYGAIWTSAPARGDMLPPSYFMLARLFDQALGPEELAARILSAFALAIGLLIIFDCARRLTDNLHALASLALLSCSLLPYYGYEARPYSLYFMFTAMELWLWVHAPDNRKSSAVLFGMTFFLAFSVHYYSALCLLPYGAFEAARWKPWRPPSPKLLAGILGVLCGIAVFSRPIVAARALSHGFWASPSPGGLLRIFGEFFPFGSFLAAAALIWIAWTSWPETLQDPMLSERVGWYFLLIPIAGYVAAVLVTNAFHSRYFIGMLPGVALAFACLLWRHFHHRPGLSARIVLFILLIGVGHQVSVTAKPSAIEPPSDRRGPAKLREALASEAIAMRDGKKNIAVRLDSLTGLEAYYYSKHPERYAFVLTPDMTVVGRINQNVARYRSMRLWSLEDLRSAARDTALIDPSREILKVMIDGGFRIQLAASDEINIVYFE